MDDPVAAPTPIADPSQSKFKIYSVPIIVLLASIGISALSIYVTIRRVFGCLLSFGCSGTSITDVLSLIGIFNALVLVPIAFILAKKSGREVFHKLLIPLILLAIIASVPVLYVAQRYITQSVGRVAEPWLRSNEINDIQHQIEAARQANISFDAKAGTLKKVTDTQYKTEYEALVPLVIKNIPKDLNSYSLIFEEIEDENGKLLDFSGHGSIIEAEQKSGVWQYSSSDEISFKRVTTSEPLLRIYLTTTQGETLPKLKSIPLYMKLTAPRNNYSGGDIVQSTFITRANIPLNLE